MGALKARRALLNKNNHRTVTIGDHRRNIAWCVIDEGVVVVVCFWRLFGIGGWVMVVWHRVVTKFNLVCHTSLVIKYKLYNIYTTFEHSVSQCSIKSHISNQRLRQT